MQSAGAASLKGRLSTKVYRRHPKGLAGLARRVSNAWWALMVGAPVIKTELRARHYIAAEDRWVDHGVVCRKVVTDVFISELCTLLAGGTLGNFNDFLWHDSGVGTTGPTGGNTDIETTDGESRVSGDQTASAPDYISVGTIAYSTGKAITEHGLFDEVTVGTMLDRNTFGAINVVNGDSIQFTYTLTISGS